MFQVIQMAPIWFFMLSLTAVTATHTPLVRRERARTLLLKSAVHSHDLAINIDWLGAIKLETLPKLSLQKFRENVSGVPVYTYQSASVSLPKGDSLEEVDRHAMHTWYLFLPNAWADRNVNGFKGSMEAQQINVTYVSKPDRGHVPMIAIETSKQVLDEIIKSHRHGIELVDQHVDLHESQDGSDGSMELPAQKLTSPVTTCFDEFCRFWRPDYTSAKCVEKCSWGLERIRNRTWIAPDKDGTNGLDIHRNSETSLTGEGVDIYVIDTGVNILHPQFEPWGSRRATGCLYDAYKPCPSWYQQKNKKKYISCGFDRNGHGTYIASIAAGKTVGVAPKAQVLSVHVSDSSHIPSSGWYPYKMFNLILEHHEKRSKNNNQKKTAIISFNWGSKWTAREAEFKFFNKMAQAGLLFVTSAGNDNRDSCEEWPAGIEQKEVGSLVSVGATNMHDERASFSNWGACIDLFAPGEQVLGASNENRQAMYGQEGEPWYLKQSRGQLDVLKVSRGTSISAPYVAGAAALLLQLWPTLPPRDLRNLLVYLSTQGAVKNSKSPWTSRSILYVPKNKQEVKDTLWKERLKHGRREMLQKLNDLDS
jgi:subtilisin family serine protease